MKRRRTLDGCMVVVMATAGVLAVAAAPASGATLNVTNTNDSGPGSLRQAVIDAANTAEDDVIVVQPGLGTITLTSGAIIHDGPFFNPALEIQGNGITINANGATSALIEAEGGDPFVVSGVTITGIGAGGSGHVGAVVSDGGGVTLSDCNIFDNVLSTTGDNFAAPVLSVGNPIIIDNCTITGNTVTAESDAAGGVLSQGDPVTITNSTISGNSVSSSERNVAGGVYSNGHTVTFRNVTVNCNSATLEPGEGGYAAGGLLSMGGAVNLTSSSIQGNVAEGAGQTIESQYLNEGGAENLIDTVISDDRAVCQAPPTTNTTTAPASATTTAATPPVVRPSFTG